MRDTDTFRRDAMHIATTSVLTRPQAVADFGVGLSKQNTWGQKHLHDDLMSGPHNDVEKGKERLRKEVWLLREERDMLERGCPPFEIGPKLLDQDFSADAPNRKWASDISCIWTREGRLYLSLILNLSSRHRLGCQQPDET